MNEFESQRVHKTFGNSNRVTYLCIVKYKAYIQCKKKTRIPIDDWAYTAYQGFNERKTKVVLFNDIDKVPVSKYNFLVAGIEETQKYLAKLNIIPVRGLNIPEELESFAGRKVSVMTLESFIRDAEVPVFVKPHTELKEFPAGVITIAENKRIFLGGYEPDTLCQTSTIIDIASEYRGFVINKELKSLNRYFGDFIHYPDVSIINKAISMYTNAPIGYTIDFCVTTDNKTLLVECNDGWSIGSYGCDSRIYTDLLVRRWMEIINSNRK